MKSVTQEEPMGCGIACVAMALNKSYKSAKRLFDNPEYALTRGYYCREIIKVLNQKRKNYDFLKVNEKNKSILNKEGGIVFIERSKKYPAGHYLIKTKKGWMNPWINFPNISPGKSGFQKILPGKAQWIIYPFAQ
jgi:hypothetical protein